MASPAILNFESLLAPIPGANPAGVPLSPELRRKLDDKRKDKDPKKFAPNDPLRPEKYEPPDWAGIVEIATQAVEQSSKDLLVAARLSEALVKEQGFGGLRDGLRLMRRMVGECWDRIHPIIEEGDLEVRATAFLWLDDELKAARFPYTVRTVPLTRGGEGQIYSYQTWKDAQDSRGAVTAAEFDQAVAATAREHCQAVADDLGEAVAEVAEVTKILGERMGEAAPSLSQLRQALNDCQDLTQMILKRKGPAPAAGTPPAEAAAPANGTASAAPSPAARPITREDVLNRLADASALLLDMEPHSPIAYLVQRAVRLARLPLPDLIRVLVRDQNVLVQLDRDLDLGLDKGDAKPEAKGKK
jgi:type VI secretion system protein ImpA